MADPIFQGLTGDVDGANKDFAFANSYGEGTTAVYLNGQLLTSPTGNPWTESNPVTGLVTLDDTHIPEPGDEISGFAIGVGIGLGVIERNVVEIRGTLDRVGELAASFDASPDLTASVQPVQSLGAQLEQDTDLDGTVRLLTLSGNVEVC